MVHPHFRSFIFIIFVLANFPVLAKPPTVVATIKPIHSLVAGVMDGISKPILLIRGNQSPHSYSLKPSTVKLLKKSTRIFLVGKGLETFLMTIANLHGLNGRFVKLSDIEELILHQTRDNGIWRNSEQKLGNTHLTNKKHIRKRSNIDTHIWLDPQNARVMVRTIVNTLKEIDPKNSHSYVRNANRLDKRLQDLIHEISLLLASSKQYPYLVFHDAFQYFEKRFKTSAVGSIIVDVHRAPGAKRLYQIRKYIIEKNIRCVYLEPQHQSNLLYSVVQGTDTKTAILDPLGAKLRPGPNAYFELIRQLAHSITTCTAKSKAH